MKIIKQGNPDLLKKTKRFVCEKCGCVFEADDGEYKEATQYQYTDYGCKCPTCHNMTWNEIYK